MKTLWWHIFAIISMSLSSAAVYAQEAVPVLRWDFENIVEGQNAPPLPPGWIPSSQQGIAVERTGQGNMCLHVWVDEAGGSQSRNIRYRLPVDKLRGQRVRISAIVRAKAVSQPPNPWNGIKCMLRMESGGEIQWPQIKLPVGDFDWRPAQLVVAVPEDCQQIDLIVGLENVTGEVWFDNIAVNIIPRKKLNCQNGEVFKGHNLPRLRGAMIGPHMTDADLLEFGKVWKANHIRWQLIWNGFPHSPADTATLDEYRQWLDGALQRLEAALPVCREAGILVTIDLHTPPGGRNKALECRIFHDREFQEAFMNIWENIARRFVHSDVVWGYDLVNEPVEGSVPDGLMNWQQLAEETARRVRAIDPRHAIIIEPAPWGSPSSIALFDPIDAPGVVYSVHMYVPHAFTHQGVYDNPMGIVYPGTIDGKWYDRDTLRRVLEPVRRFQEENGVHIYIGEFSAIRWAPGDSAYQYLKDCIEIFEEFGWDWAYHAFREWDGWSVEHGPDRNDRSRTATPTDRALLLRSWYAKNVKPEFSERKND
ncbi:MAG: cellulase family glycosylhydrolase [Thermogutta sp.]|uniref:glycoside hydrolase family 5 protein n=1 Tax=Thermogutta sp. TaxID=1962930 RepID=UPI0019C81368|nr:cellulase family glycosylhydrolase [Thermogutta sp.]MBC7351098.1 cellulase family glycosylhydrolase [Thermogutta sp.]